MPISQTMDGRDHNPDGFTVWLAGAASRAEPSSAPPMNIGYRAIEEKQSVYDLHATILHLLGMDHEKLTYHFNGRDMRLTDVHGNVIREVLA